SEAVSPQSVCIQHHVHALGPAIPAKIPQCALRLISFFAHPRGQTAKNTYMAMDSQSAAPDTPLTHPLLANNRIAATIHTETHLPKRCTPWSSPPPSETLPLESAPSPSICSAASSSAAPEAQPRVASPSCSTAAPPAHTHLCE